MEALSGYWLKHPPVHLSVAAYVGWGGSKGSADQGDVDMLLAGLPTMEVNPNGK